MAETSKRSQLIQEQIKQLQGSTPEPYTKEEAAQIMKGRGKLGSAEQRQKDLDAGRQLIEARQQQIKEHNEKIEGLLGKFDTAVKEEGGESLRQERESSADPLKDTFAPWAVGAGAGLAYGEVINSRWNGANKKASEAMTEISEELGPTRRLTNSNLNIARARGADQAAQKFQPNTGWGKAARGAAKVGTFAVPAAAAMFEYNQWQKRAEAATSDKERKANQAIANGFLGLSVAVGAESARPLIPHYSKGQGKAEARIAGAREFADLATKAKAAKEAAPARATRVKAPAATPPAAVAAPAETSAASTALTVPKGGPKLPGGVGAAAIAAGLGYALSPSDAEAGTGAPTGGNSQALQNAAVTGGTAYGLNRIGAAIPAIGRAAGAGLSMLNPTMTSDMMDSGYEFSPEENERAQGAENSTLNMLARNVPESMQFGPISQAREMAQVPERNMDQTDEYANARALQIPEGIPDNAAAQAEAEAQATEQRTPWMLPHLAAQKERYQKQSDFDRTLAEMEQFLQAERQSP